MNEEHHVNRKKPTRLKWILLHRQLLSTECPPGRKETFRLGCCGEAKIICPEFTACNLISSASPRLRGMERGQSRTHGSRGGCPKSHPTGDNPQAPGGSNPGTQCGKARAFGEGSRVYGAAGWGTCAGRESFSPCLNPKHRGEEEEEELWKSSRHGKRGMPFPSHPNVEKIHNCNNK